MNIREYFVARFPDYDLSNNVDLRDGATVGEVLAEMEMDTLYGRDCKTLIDVAAIMIDRIRIALGDKSLTSPAGRTYVNHVLDATTDVLCYIIRK